MESNTPDDKAYQPQIDEAYQQAIEMATPSTESVPATPALEDNLVQDTQASLPSRLVSDAYDQALEMAQPGSGDVGEGVPDAPGIVSGDSLNSAYDQALDMAKPGSGDEAVNAEPTNAG